MINEQIKSRKRVSDFGEVYTNDREIEAMIALVAKKAYKVEATFLEPSCGNGNFLIAILKRKMKTVVEQFYDNKLKFEIYTLVAVSSIYGIDIQDDNIKESRNRIVCSVVNIIKEVFKDEPSNGLLKSIEFVLNKNILCGDFLSCTLANGDPIVLSEWKLTDNYFFRRKDFLLEHSVCNEIHDIQSDYIYYKWFKDIYFEGKEDTILGGKRKIS
ncbi:hypothetical protein AAK882_02690 [Carnobacteriaceae bacterium 52-44]